MKQIIYQIDAFTDRVFGGNPAAVCPLEEWLDDDVLRKIAAENNLSETAFFVKRDGDIELRWFTPKMEVELCGHATLATAYVIFTYDDYDEPEIKFSTKSGILKVTQKDGHLSMNFPARPPESAEDNPKLIEGLGAKPMDVLKSRDYLVVYDDQQTIIDLKPDFSLLKALDCLGIIVTAPGKTCDFVSRFFAPGAGIDEDPVTGSSHCTLIPYWANQLDKPMLYAKQISARGGELFCEYQDERVEIAGDAVTYLIGEINI